MAGLVAFLSSPTGLLAVAVTAVVLMAVLTAVFWSAISAPRLLVGEAGPAGVADRDVAQTALLVAAALVVPTLFTIALSDVFVLPKVTALRVTLVVALILLGWGALRRPGTAGLTASRTALAIDLTLLAYAGLTILATIFSIDPAHSLVGENEQYQGLLTTLLYVAFFYLARTSFTDQSRLSLLAVAIIVGATLVALYAILQQLGLDPIWSSLPKGRVFSTIGQADWLAAYLVLGLPLGAALLGQVRSIARLPVAASLALVLIGLLLTMSRGGYLGVCVAAAAFVAAVARRARPARRWLLAVPAFGVLSLLTVSVPPVRQEAEVILSRAASTADLAEGSIADRLELWRVGVAIAIDHPVLGTGPDTFPLLFPRYRDSLLASRRDFWLHYRPESPHNVYLAIAAGAGIPALAAYLAFLGAIFVDLARRLRGVPSRAARFMVGGVLAAAAGHLVTDMFMTGEVTGSWLFWLLLGAGVGYVETTRSSPSLVEAFATATLVSGAP